MHIARRLVREFWLPALVAVAWTVFNISSAGSWDTKSVINIFGPSFFLVSWATAQYFRLQKQVGVDKNFSSIESRVTALIDRLEKHTTDFLGYTTGGDSWAAFSPAIPHDTNIVEFMIHNESKYPVFDIYAEAIDLDEPIDPDKGKFWTRHRFVLQSLYPNKAVLAAYRFNLAGKQRLRVNIFVQARNGGLTQEFRIERVANWFAFATTTTVDGNIVKQEVPENFPGFDPADPAKVFK